MPGPPSLVNTGSNGSGTPVTNISVTYTPTVGNTVLVGLIWSSGTTAPSVGDSNDVFLNAGASNSNTGKAQWFWYVVPQNITPVSSYTANWTTSRDVVMVVIELTNCGSVVTTVSGGSSTGASTSASCSPVSIAVNDFILSILGDTVSAATFTATSGTSLGTASSPVSFMIVYNIATSGGQTLTNSASLSPSRAWETVSIIVSEIAPTMDWTLDAETQDNFAYKASPNQYHGSFFSVDPDVDTNVPQYTFPSATDIILMDYKGYSIPTASKVDTTDYAIQFTVIPGITRLYAYDNDVENQVAQLVYATDRDVLDTGVELITLPPFIDDMWVVDDVEDDAS